MQHQYTHSNVSGISVFGTSTQTQSSQGGEEGENHTVSLSHSHRYSTETNTEGLLFLCSPFPPSFPPHSMSSFCRPFHPPSTVSLFLLPRLFAHALILSPPPTLSVGNGGVHVSSSHIILCVFVCICFCGF